jgi:hypothetical protein
MTRKQQNKYQYVHVLQGDYGYGHGWEDLSNGTHRECRADRREYETSGHPARYRIIQRRELNP